MVDYVISAAMPVKADTWLYKRRRFAVSRRERKIKSFNPRRRLSCVAATSSRLVQDIICQHSIFFTLLEVYGYRLH